jgi:hypothetical protein
MKLHSYKIGDVLEIVDTGHVYTTFNVWADWANATNWKKGYSPVKGTFWKVVNFGYHYDMKYDFSRDEFGKVSKEIIRGNGNYNDRLYLLEDQFERQIIMGENGLSLHLASKSDDFLTIKDFEI